MENGGLTLTEPEPLMSLDLVQYRLKLMEIRRAFESKLKSKCGFHTMQDIEVFWHCLDTEPVDNVFGRFKYYKCSVPNCTTRDASGQHSWYLYWNPKIVPKEKRKSNVHALCSNTLHFTTPSVDIQKMIIDGFPKAFQLYLGNGLDGKTLSPTNEFYVANKGFTTSSSSVNLTLDRERLRDLIVQTTQTPNSRDQASSSSAPAPALMASTQPIDPEPQPSCSSSSGSTGSGSGTKRTADDAFIDYLKAELQNLSEDEQGEFKVSTVDILRKIKRNSP